MTVSRSLDSRNQENKEGKHTQIYGTELSGTQCDRVTCSPLRLYVGRQLNSKVNGEVSGAEGGYVKSFLRTPALGPTAIIHDSPWGSSQPAKA